MERRILTLLPNPNVKDLKRIFGQLRRLPLCNAESETGPWCESDQDPGAEYTMLGWVLSERIPSNDMQVNKEFFLSSSQFEFEKLCSTDGLGLTDKQQYLSESQFHQDFTEHLKQTEEGS